MNLNEFLSASRAALTQTSTDGRMLSLVGEAERLADMVSWATGPIDPQSRLAAVFDALKHQARLRFEQTRNPEVAQFHDALGDLLNAIVSHDDDLDPDGIGASVDDD